MTKNDVKEIQALKQAKGRKERGIFAVEGNKLVEELINSKFRVNNIFATEVWVEKNPVLAKKIADYEVITPKQMEQISNFVTPPGVFATAMMPKYKIEPKDTENQLVLLLDGINDPGNLGTIIRTADWFGIRHIVCSPDCVEFYNPKTIQATMGSFTHVCMHKRPLATFLEQESSHRRILGTFLNGESIGHFDFQSSDIVVIGNESNGISPEVAATVTHRITIPSASQGLDTAESLNAAVAAAVVMFQWRGVGC